MLLGMKSGVIPSKLLVSSQVATSLPSSLTTLARVAINSALSRALVPERGN
jgi:hypothetical protein